jgi:hypothetical protein
VVLTQTSARSGISERDHYQSDCPGNIRPIKMMNHGCMWRSATDRHTTESVGKNKLMWKQEIARKLVRAKL